MSTNLTSLNTHLFSQLDRLSAEGLSPEQLELELKRTDAITDVAREIINNAALVLRAATVRPELPMSQTGTLKLLE